MDNNCGAGEKRILRAIEGEGEGEKHEDFVVSLPKLNSERC
jgi:hypothetical protein